MFPPVFPLKVRWKKENKTLQTKKFPCTPPPLLHMWNVNVNIL